MLEFEFSGGKFLLKLLCSQGSMKLPATCTVTQVRHVTCHYRRLPRQCPGPGAPRCPEPAVINGHISEDGSGYEEQQGRHDGAAAS